MRFGAAFWINRTTWPALRDAARAVERAGWDTLYVDDHLLADEGDWTDGKLEGWTTLAALAGETERVRLGLLVAANGFREPGLTAKLATTVDHLSDGRLILGIGGGWFEREHDAFGFDFGSGFGERLDRLDEAVGLIRGSPDPRGYEIMLPRRVAPSEIVRARALPRAIGWRYFPEAKGKAPWLCDCPVCEPRGEVKAGRQRVRLAERMRRADAARQGER